MGHAGDNFEHTPRKGCDCDLCRVTWSEMNAWAEERAAASVEHQEAHAGPAEGASLVCLTCPALVDAGCVLCLECATEREEGDALPVEAAWTATGDDAWWLALDAAVARRDRAMVSRLTGAQDPSTADDVDAFVAMLAARAGEVTNPGRRVRS